MSQGEGGREGRTEGIVQSYEMRSKPLKEKC